MYPIAHSLPAEASTGKPITAVTSLYVGRYRASYRCPTKGLSGEFKESLQHCVHGMCSAFSCSRDCACL